MHVIADPKRYPSLAFNPFFKVPLQEVSYSAPVPHPLIGYHLSINKNLYWGDCDLTTFDLILAQKSVRDRAHPWL